MAVPGQDERDWEFAEAFGLPIVRTVQPPDGWEGKAYTGEGPAINSRASSTASGVAEAKRAIIDWLAKEGYGEGTVTYKLRDWLFSRQRYWGEPFPIVYDETGLPIALPDDELPVRAARDRRLLAPQLRRPTTSRASRRRRSAAPSAWATVELDLGDGPKRYRRELNTMPQWAGSCWYELRYLDPTNENAFVDPDVEQYWMGPQHEGDTGGVDLYVGGVEHAVLHLLYARFWHKVLFDLGHVIEQRAVPPAVQPGLHPGRRLHRRAGRLRRGRRGGGARRPLLRRHGEAVTRECGKMGKSLKNAVTPDELYDEYGADTLRLYEMSMGPLDASRPVGDPRRRRHVPVPAAAVAQPGRRGDRRAPGARRAGRRRQTRRLLHRTIDGVRARHGRAAVQHRHRQADRAEQPPHAGGGDGRSTPARWPSRWC